MASRKPQLVGSTCAICRERISNELDARFCDACGHPRHTGCARWPGDPSESRCRVCGATVDPTDTAAAPEAPPPSAQPEGPVPVAQVCPKCSSGNHKRVKPRAWVAFRWDRVCKECQTRYTPPTPTWAALLFLLAGSLLTGVGFLGVAFAILRGDPVAIPTAVCEGFVGAIGCAAVVHGIRSLIKPGEV